MKKYFALFILALFCFVTVSCRTTPAAEPQPDPIISREKKKNERLAKQTKDQMAKSKQIPSVDFEFDGIKLDPSAYPILDKVAQILVENRHWKLIVEGHTDFIGSEEYNDWLSKARAMAVKSYLVSRDVHPDSIMVYGYGKRRPITMDDSPEGRATNRRVVFIITTRYWQSVY
ncbi:OmpA-OmpF porin [Parelusimicrobium proximum]|uniref:OmpA family protein n=1 Tax=Parelusimicrobium proximum TaxID=3228953 RepID=UPI003D164C66